MEKKSFHIGDILSITTHHLVSHDHIGGVYNLLDWMTDESLMTHQLGRASDVALPYLLQEFPFLEVIKYPTGMVEKDAIFDWVDKQAILHGDWHEVSQLPEGVYIHQDPIEEYLGRFPDKTLIPVVVPE